MRKIIRIAFIPASLFLWFVFSYWTLQYPCGADYCPEISNISLYSLIALLVIYTSPIIKFLIKKFNLKTKARWFFYYFLASATIILLTEIVPFLDKIEVNGLFALLFVASCGISFVFSLSLEIKNLFSKPKIKITEEKIENRVKNKLPLLILTIIALLFTISIATDKIRNNKINSQAVDWAQYRSSEIINVVPSSTPTESSKPKQALTTSIPKTAPPDWAIYRAKRINDLKGALKIVEEEIAFYKSELDKLLKQYDELITLYQSDSITQEEFESTSKKFIDADNFIRSTLRELAKEADTYINLIRRFENGENITPAEEKTIRGI